MVLAVDVGNTQTVVGLFAGRRLLHHWRLPSRRDATADELFVILRSLLLDRQVAPAEPRAVVVASVVPGLTGVWVELAANRLGIAPLVVDWRADTGLSFAIDNPAELGADRIVNAVAGWRQYGAPLVVVDFGTATTVDAVGAGGTYLGGAIAPGVGIAAEALFRAAARLLPVELTPPPQAIGRNTSQALQSGILIGCGGQVDALVEQVRAEMGGRARVVATGGLAERMQAQCRTIEVVNPFLTLEGLCLVQERIAQGGAAKPDNPTVAAEEKLPASRIDPYPVAEASTGEGE